MIGTLYERREATAAQRRIEALTSDVRALSTQLQNSRSARSGFEVRATNADSRIAELDATLAKYTARFGALDRVGATDAEVRQTQRLVALQERANFAAAQAKVALTREIRTGASGPAGGFRRALEIAAEKTAQEDFAAASEAMRMALAQRPAGESLPDASLALLADLQRPIAFEVHSDEATLVSIVGGQTLGRFGSKVVSLPMGDYKIVGQKEGYADDVMVVKVRKLPSGEKAQVVEITATQPDAP